MLRKSKRPGAGDTGPDGGITSGDRSTSEFTPSNHQPQASKGIANATLTQPPVTRGRAWEDYDRKEISFEREEAANELNRELAKAFNEAIRFVDQSDDDQDDWYWTCHAELFGLLDTVYLMMREMDVTDAEAFAVASATRKHFRRAMERWRTRQIELMDEALAFYDRANKPSDSVPVPLPKLPDKRTPAKWSAPDPAGATPRARAKRAPAKWGQTAKGAKK